MCCKVLCIRINVKMAAATAAADGESPFEWVLGKCKYRFTAHKDKEQLSAKGNYKVCG